MELCNTTKRALRRPPSRRFKILPKRWERIGFGDPDWPRLVIKYVPCLCKLVGDSRLERYYAIRRESPAVIGTGRMAHSEVIKRMAGYA